VENVIKSFLIYLGAMCPIVLVRGKDWSAFWDGVGVSSL